MTENLAGRGEGLAGLVAMHEPQHYCPQGPVSGINGTYTIAFLGCSCGWNSDGEASKTEKWSEHVIAALEAAAPPSTPNLRGLAYKIYDKVMELENGEGGCSLYDYCIDLNHPSGFDESRVDKLLEPIIEMLRAALATPSPQTPQLCQRCGQPDADGGGVFVDKEDVLREEWLCGACISKELRELRMPAATQSPSTFGSPRKVGEEAQFNEAADAVVRWANGWKSRMEAGLYDVDGMKAADIRRDEGMDIAKHLRSLRPSSVPVGEQKQEEGV